MVASGSLFWNLDPFGSFENGEGGIRTHGGFSLAGFQDRPKALL